MRSRTKIAIGLALALGLGCKGETKVQADPQTVAALDMCEKNGAEKDKLIKSVQDENARCLKDHADSGEYVVTIEGANVTVKARPSGGGGGNNVPVDDKQLAAASKAFTDQVVKSRGAIQKCYEQALKKDANLQARTVSLIISASFQTTGSYRDGSASFTPELGTTFDSCMRAIAQKWTVPNPPIPTFRETVSLIPS
jgi:hypothetical protein